ncbi:conserved Plasmodium protein, unknown function [Plasmodium sp. gorilla clade G3]|nr:conserved Plasmodium protein, unknown function [Plasmodium sp. gorilla clade G3]
MNFDDFVKTLYEKNVFDDENSEYIKNTIFPFLIPLIKLVNDEKEKHKYFNLIYNKNEKELLSNTLEEKKETNIEQVDIFSTDKFKTNPTELFDIQKEVIKRYIKINPILLLSEYIMEEYKSKNHNDDNCNEVKEKKSY